MSFRSTYRLILCLPLVLAACTGPAAPRTTGSDPISSTEPKAPKTLTIAYEEEPSNLSITFGASAGASAGGDLRLAVHQRLATYNNLGALHPMLAVELPTQANGTWIVRPDGTMQTIYRLRPNVTWHDGAPFRAQDVVFAWNVTRDPDVPTSQRTVATQIERIETPDDATLIIEWKASYPFANAIVEDDLGPMPAHLLEPLFRADKDRFVQSPYWTREFVGVGPYRLAEWEPGSHLTLRAYDGFHGARAKIDTLVVRFLGDENSVVAALLGGSIDGQLPSALQFDQAIFVQKQWEQAGRTPVVVVQPEKWRYWFTQFRNPSPSELSDVRVRRALLHAVDREALVATLVGGRVPIADSFIAPDDPRSEWVKDVTARYAFDTRRSSQLLAEVGWTQRPDGTLVNAAGSPVSVQAWADAGRQDEQEVAIVADMWKATGLQTEQYFLPLAQQRDGAFRASFPGFYAKEIPLGTRTTLTRVHGPGCPTEQSRWVGGSLGCYQNAQLDRAVDALTVTIDPTRQRELYREIIGIHTQEVPVLPMYFNANVTVFRQGVTGVKGNTVPRTSATWNVTEWDVN